MSELGTKYIFVGGNNVNRIGGSCSVIEHKYDKMRPPTRIMLDLGALFAPDDCMDVDAIMPDVRKYLNKPGELAEQNIDALFLSHAHEDHIGGYVHLMRAGYEMPPTYASKGTLELLKYALNEAGVDYNKWPKMIEVESGVPVKFNEVEVEGIDVSHSTFGAMGFHILTTINNQDEAGIFHLGDFHLGKVKIGNGFDEEKLKDLLQRKLLTDVILDSTSTSVSDEYLVDFDDAVKNTVEVVSEHKDKQVVSSVISRSVQNLVIDLEVARKTGRKVYIDGHWARLAYKAMKKAGVTEYDDVVFSRGASEYKATYSESERYIIVSGAFAESKKGRKSGLFKMSEQEKIVKRKNNNKSSEKNKKRVCGHPDFEVGGNTLVLARQRCIEEINGKQVRGMYARLAALGATIVANVSEVPLGNFKTAKMQRSGHAVLGEMKKLIQLIKKYAKNFNDIIFVPTHGNPKQLLATCNIVKDEKGKLCFAINLDILKMSKEETKKVGRVENDAWIGVCEEMNNTSGDRKYTYTLTDNNFIVLKELMSTVIKGKVKKKVNLGNER